MTSPLAEQLARRVRIAAGPHDNPDMSVQQVVSAMAARISELEAALIDVRGHLAHYLHGGSAYRKPAAAAARAIDSALLAQQGKEGET